MTNDVDVLDALFCVPSPDPEAQGERDEGRPLPGARAILRDLRVRLGGPAQASADELDRRARVALSRVCEPDGARVARIINRKGAYGALQQVATFDHKDNAGIQTRIQTLDVDRDLAIGRRCGARILVPQDELWPSAVNDLEAPPACLWVRGPVDLRTLYPRSVSIVGSRGGTPYGTTTASSMASDLAQRGFGIVSGAALGVDAAAHMGALAVDGVTVAVLAGGVDRPYPQTHDRLIARIVEVGAVVSEVAPGSSHTRQRFLARNRLIAALTYGTVVVEASLRSGTANTARHARGIHRAVAAVPGPVSSMMSMGCHKLIREYGAELVTDADDVAELMGTFGRDIAPLRRGDARAEDMIDPQDRGLFDALPLRSARPPERLAITAGLGIDQVYAGLARLQLLGMATRCDDGWKRAPTNQKRRCPSQ